MDPKTEASQSLGCIFCYKLTNGIATNCCEQETFDSKPQKDVQGRFFSLLLRHLIGEDKNKRHAYNLQREFTSLLFGEDFESTLENIMRVCQECLTIVEEFCSLYHQIKCLELRVNWQVEKLWNVMRVADQVPLGAQQFTQAGVINGNHQLWEINNLLGFRRHLKRQCKLHQNKLFPRVVLPKKLDICENGGTGNGDKYSTTWTPAQEEEVVLNEETEVDEPMDLECELSELTIKTVTSLSDTVNPLDKKDSLNDVKMWRLKQDVEMNQMQVPGGASTEQLALQTTEKKQLCSSWNLELEHVGSGDRHAPRLSTYLEKPLPPPPPIIVHHKMFSNNRRNKNGNMITLEPEKKRTSKKISRKMEKVKCNFCGIICSSRETLQAHKNTHSKDSPWTCSICSIKLSHKGALIQHNISFHVENFFLKSKIGCLLPREQLKARVSELVKRTVDSCGKQSNEGGINNGAEKRYKCVYCSVDLATKQSTTVHLFWQHYKILEQKLEQMESLTHAPVVKPSEMEFNWETRLLPPELSITKTVTGKKSFGSLESLRIARTQSFIAKRNKGPAGNKIKSTRKRLTPIKQPTNLSKFCSICSCGFRGKSGLMQHNISFHIENFFMDSKLECLSGEQFRNHVVHLVSKTVDSFGIRPADVEGGNKGEIKFKCKYCSLQLANKSSTTVHLFWCHTQILKENLEKLQQSMKPEEISYYSNSQEQPPQPPNPITCSAPVVVENSLCDDRQEFIPSGPRVSSGVVAKLNATFGATQLNVGGSYSAAAYGCLGVKREPNEFLDEDIYPD